MSHFGDLLKGK